jgi:hypothetical protein
MNTKTTRAYDMPTETMDGKTYRVLPSEVINIFRGQEEERIKNLNPEWSAEKVNEEVDKILDQMGVGSSSCIYEKMTTDEKQRFEAQYRFGGITRVRK